MRFFRSLFIIGLALLLAGCASAVTRQQAGKSPHLVRITGSRVAQPSDRLGRIPATAYPLYVITREDIERTGATDAGAALNDLPFLDIRR